MSAIATATPRSSRSQAVAFELHGRSAEARGDVHEDLRHQGRDEKKDAEDCVEDQVPARAWMDFDQDVEHAVITLTTPYETIDGVA